MTDRGKAVLRFEDGEDRQVLLGESALGLSAERFVAIVRAAWADAAKNEVPPDRAMQALTRIVRLRVGGLSEYSSVDFSLGTAEAIDRAFRIQVEFGCAACGTHRVVRSGAWRDLRDALAPEGLPDWLRPSRTRPVAPSDADLARCLERSLDDRLGFSCADRELERHLRKLAPMLCPVCLPLERARLREFVGTYRARFAANVRRESQERAAQARLARECSPYVIVSAQPATLGREVSAWISRGYEIWGSPQACDGQLCQALIRPSAAPRCVDASGTRAPDRWAQSAQDGPRDALLERSIATLDLSTRAFNCLSAHDIRRLRDLVRLTEAQVREMQNLGQRSFSNITEALGRFGLRLGMSGANRERDEGCSEGGAISEVSIRGAGAGSSS